MFASFQKKYFLSDKGIAGVKRGIFWTTLTNLITMAGMGFLFLVMAGFVEHLAHGADLPDALPIVGGLVIFFVLLFASNWQQYYYTYCIFYEECGKQRMEIAERLRKLPLSFFGRRDLADLTETIMGDVQAMEHAYSHVLGELWGAIIASAIVFVASLFFCWQLAIAAFWSVPVAFAVLYLTRGPMTPVFDHVRAEKVKVTEAIQETLDCVREIRATNQEAHYLQGAQRRDRCRGARDHQRRARQWAFGQLRLCHPAPGHCHHVGHGRCDGRLRPGRLFDDVCLPAYGEPHLCAL